MSVSSNNNTAPSGSLLLALIIPTIIIFITGAIGLQQLIPAWLEKNIVDDTVKTAEQTISEYKTRRNFDADSIVKKALDDKNSAAVFDLKKISPATEVLAALFHDHAGEQGFGAGSIKLYSPFPFAGNESRKLDTFGNEAWQFLNSAPDKAYVKTMDNDGVYTVRVAMADTMVSSACVSCHNSHPESSKTNWTTGDVSGVFEIEVDISTQLSNAGALGNRIAVVVLVIAVVSIFLTALMFKNKIAGPLASVRKDAKQISEGNLIIGNEKLSNDAVGMLRQSLKEMKENLANVIMGIREGAHGVSDSAEQVSQGNLNLSQRTQEQASSLEEVASTMEQMTEAVNHNAENAARAKDLAFSANEIAGKSLVVVSSTIGAMASIEKSNKKIADIIGVIQNIAFQTNLLALNAAVEAARAGEQGRGFAVVASEVRDLAGRSARAAKEIKELIDDSVSKVEDGSNLIDETGEALSEINSAVDNVAAVIAEIAAASREQSAGITQVNKAILQMDEMTQSNASLVEEAAAASEALGAQAEELASLVSYFTMDNSVSHVVPRVQDNRKEIHEIEKPSPRAALPRQEQQGGNEDDEWKDF